MKSQAYRRVRRLAGRVAAAAILAATPLAPAGTATAQEPSTGAPPNVTLPRAALVDMTRAQSRVICSSEPFLGCMGFDARECLALSESAIERCLMALPAEIDPTELDHATLEACPRKIYADAGYREAEARVCFEEAIEAGSGEPDAR